MLKTLKWELKKAVHSWGYLMHCMIGVLVIVWIIPASEIVIIPSIALVVGCLYLMYLPMNNMMLLMKQPSFIFEKQRRKSGYEQLVAKLCVNGVITTLMLFFGHTGNFIMKRFETASYGYFHYDLRVPVLQAWFEMAIFFPVVFLCIYFWLGKKSKMSHGILSGILSCIICGLFSTMNQSLWIVILIEVIISVILIYLLGKWIEKANEPYM